MSFQSTPPAVIDELVKELAKVNPNDVLQHCADFFHKKLAAERSGHLGKSGSNNAMADEGDPFDTSARNANTIEEEDEERDSFAPDAPLKSQTGGKSSSGFGGWGAALGGAAAGGAGGGLFGSWLGSSGGSEESDKTANQSVPSNYAGNRRTSVSAESMQPEADSSNWKPPKHQKTQDQLDRLKTAVASNFLFSQLDDESFSTVLDALVEKSIPAANIKVITQGDEGDYFYVIESGEFDIYINPSGSVQSGADGMGNKVTTIGSGGSFGELALMYNAPRAATVVSANKGGMLWALDRITFRRILMDNAFQKRKMYEGFLEEVPLLSSLKPYERAKIADALETAKFSTKSNIITEGEPGDAFYLLESGTAAAYKHGIDKPVKEYKRGDFFGELALLDDKPRAASVVATSHVKVAKLGRDGFKRLLGPVESIMRREEYEKADQLDPLSKQQTVT